VSEELDELIEMARMIRMTPEQAERQRRSFAYGNVKIENDFLPWDTINQAAERLEKKKCACSLLRESGLGRAMWGVKLFSGACGTSEVVPFPRILAGARTRG
jgi:hypothetical protein